MSDEAFKRLRVAIVGSCQVVGLAAAARRLLPGAEVSSWHVGVYPKDTDEEILTALRNFDVAISQLSDSDQHVPLRVTNLKDQGLPVVYLPVMVFPGFHPDITYVMQQAGIIHGPMTDYHSVITAAAFTLGLPEHRVPGLFNPLVFAELGYFEAFDAAKAALITNFGEADYDLVPLIDMWLRHLGQFVYTINHPHIQVLATLCRLALVRAGYLSADVPLPEDIHDNLAGHFIWPVYPALAKRIGITGSNTFIRGAHGLAPGQNREMVLAEYVSEAYRLYQGLAKDILRVGSVATACERLGSFVVN